jgi:hypothetical protein
MRKDIFIFGAGAFLTALAVTRANDLVLWNAIQWFGIVLMAFSSLDWVLRASKRSRKVKIVANAVMATAIAVTILRAHFQTNQKLPGFGSYSVIRLYDSPEARRRFVFEFVSDGEAKVAFYLSASSVFTFAVTDIRGEIYPLEIKVGNGGIPIDQFVALFCEIGIDRDATIIRVLINEREIARRELAFPLNLGKMDWKPGSLGVPVTGVNQGGIFLLSEIGISRTTMTPKEIQALVENVRGFYGQPFN